MAKQGGGGGGGGGAGGGGDNAMAPVWITVLFMVTVYFIWFYAHEYIVAFVFKINLVQAKFFNLFFTDTTLARNIYVMETIDPAGVDLDKLMELSESVGNYTRYPVAITLVVLAVWLYSSNIILKFKKTHSMKTLRLQEQKNWTAIMPVIKHDLADTDISKGPWAMALTPMEFSRKYNLLRKDDVLLDVNTPGQELTAGIRRGDAKRVFTLQLGPYWDSFEKCSPATQVIAAVCMARMNRDRDAAKQILSTMDKTFAQGKPDFSVAKPIIKKYKDSVLVQEILPRHAYVLTVMASLMAASRDDGVVPTSEFLWLKVVDRRLWYMMNCVGRQTPYAEVAGPFAHWFAEKAMKRRSLVPMVEEAIKALEIAIKEIRLSTKQLEELQP